MNNNPKQLKPPVNNIVTMPKGIAMNQNPRKRKKKRERLREYDPS